MSNKTIAKFFNFVILASVLSLVLQGCTFARSDGTSPAASPRYSAPEVTGRIKSPDVTESSGIAASRCQSDVFWTHNDSGDEAFLFAFNSAGDNLGTWRVPNAENKDWEDLAAWKDSDGKCYLYIGEIGDNKMLWPQHTVYRVAEPTITAGGARSSRRNPLNTDNPDVLHYIYPDRDHDAETLMVHPESGAIYVLTKQLSGPAGVYKLRPDFGRTTPQKAEKVATLSVPAVPNGLLTGGDISPDGKSVVVTDYGKAYELRLPIASLTFDDVWKQAPEPVVIGKRKGGEAICYSADGSSIVATSEGRNSPITLIRRIK